MADMLSSSAPLSGAILVAMLMFAAMIRCCRALQDWIELRSAPADGEDLSVDSICRSVLLFATLLLIPLSSYRDFIMPRILRLVWCILCESAQLVLWFLAITIYGLTELVMLCWVVCWARLLDLIYIRRDHVRAARSLRARVYAERASRAATLARDGEFPLEAWVANALSRNAAVARAVSRRLARATFALRSFLERKARCEEEKVRSEQEEEARRCARRLQRARNLGRW